MLCPPVFFFLFFFLIVSLTIPSSDHFQPEPTSDRHHRESLGMALEKSQRDARMRALKRENAALRRDAAKKRYACHTL